MCGPAKPNSRQRREGIAGQESESAVRPLLLQRGHTPDNESSPRVKSCDVYSEDTQIGTPDNQRKKWYVKRFLSASGGLVNVF